LSGGGLPPADDPPLVEATALNKAAKKKTMQFGSPKPPGRPRGRPSKAPGRPNPTPDATTQSTVTPASTTAPAQKPPYPPPPPFPPKRTPSAAAGSGRQTEVGAAGAAPPVGPPGTVSIPQPPVALDIAAAGAGALSQNKEGQQNGEVTGGAAGTLDGAQVRRHYLGRAGHVSQPKRGLG
jgi:hypothetical protein